MKSRSNTIRISPKAARKLREFYDALLARYGPQQWWPAQTALEVVVGAFLTQNTSWKGVERSIALLESHGVLTLEGLRNTSEDELQQMIRPSGYMIRKAAAIKAFIQFLDDHYGGSLLTLAAESTPIARDKLLSLPGVGPETADAILLYALGQPGRCGRRVSAPSDCPSPPASGKGKVSAHPTAVARRLCRGRARLAAPALQRVSRAHRASR